MNLAMQLRRACITLGLAAVAMVCVVAKTAATTQMSAQLPALDTMPAVSLTISKEIFMTPAITLVRVGTPMRISKNQIPRKSVRCESITRI